MEAANSKTIKVCNKGNYDDFVNGLLQIDQDHHRFQKLKDQPHNSIDVPGIFVDVNQDCFDRNNALSDVNRNVNLQILKCKWQGYSKRRNRL